MGTRREYIQTMQLTKDQILKLEDYNSYFRQYGLNRLSSDQLQSALGSISTILGLVCLLPVTPTAVGVASAIMAVFSSLNVNEKSMVTGVLLQGQDGMANLRWQMDDNPDWEMVEIEVSMLQFVDESVKCIQSEPNLLRVKINGGWVS